MKYKIFQKEKEDWNLQKILKGNYFNIQRDLIDLSFIYEENYKKTV